MTALEVLDRLAELGVAPVLVDGRLFLEPGSRVPRELVVEVKAHKPEIVAALRSRRVPPDTGLEPLLQRLREGQQWLAAHYDGYMDGTEPEGPFVASIESWDILEKLLRRLYPHFRGCVNEGGTCPPDAPVCCTHCAEMGTRRGAVDAGQ